MVECSAILVAPAARSALGACVDALLPQADEIVVVHRGASDDAAPDLPESEKIILVSLPADTGLGAALNAGAKAASAEQALVFIDPDCIPAARAIEWLFKVMSAEPNIGAAGGLLLNLAGEEEQPGGRIVPPGARDTLAQAFGLKDPYTRPVAGDLPTSPAPVEALARHALMIRKPVFDQIGGWNDDFRIEATHLDLCDRVRQHGWRLLFVPGARFADFADNARTTATTAETVQRFADRTRYYRAVPARRHTFAVNWLVVAMIWLGFSLWWIRHIATGVFRRAADAINKASGR
jgi:hypothetical protein